MTIMTPEEWGNIYKENQKEYEDFRSQMENLILRLMHSNGIDASQITSRTKNIDSFVEKIKRNVHARLGTHEHEN
jgi:ppGpp synthetase/RelA/SpoT-type nucleotidyltranferase